MACRREEPLRPIGGQKISPPEDKSSSPSDRPATLRPPYMRVDPDRPLFPISTVAELLGCPPKVLRVYEQHQLVAPARGDGKRRLYSQRDIERLEFVHYLTHVRGVNLPGVKMILELLPHLDRAVWDDLVRRAEAAVRGEAEGATEGATAAPPPSAAPVSNDGVPAAPGDAAAGPLAPVLAAVPE